MSFSLKFRFLLSGVLITALVVFYAVLTLEGQKTTSLLLRDVLSRNVAAMHLAGEIKHSFVYYDDLIFRFLSTGDSTLLDESNRVHEQMKSAMEELDAQSDSPTVRDLLAQLKAESFTYFKDVHKLLVTAPRGVVPGDQASFFKMFRWAKEIPAQQKTVGLLSAKGQTKLTLVYSLCDKLLDLNRLRMEEAQKQISDALDRSEKTIRWGGCAVFGGSVLIGLFLAISILTPLKELQAGIQRIMGGDLSVEIIPGSADEIGLITQAFNAMTRQLHEKQELLVKETITDALTGLHNFRFFQQELKTETERARRYARPLSVLLIDIDHFKAFNDAHGHEMGNVVLKTVAQALRETLRPSDVLARYGGEEFVALLPETDKPQAQRVAERVREAVAVSEFPGQETQPGGKLTISLGGAAFPENAQVAQDLVEKADKALYQAKNSGRNRVEWIA